MSLLTLRLLIQLSYFFFYFLHTRNRGPSIGQVSPDQILLATGIYFHAGPPAAAIPPRTPGVRLQSHCKQTPEREIKIFSFVSRYKTNTLLL